MDNIEEVSIKIGLALKLLNDALGNRKVRKIKEAKFMAICRKDPNYDGDIFPVLFILNNMNIIQCSGFDSSYPDTPNIITISKELIVEAMNNYENISGE